MVQGWESGILAASAKQVQPVTVTLLESSVRTHTRYALYDPACLLVSDSCMALQLTFIIQQTRMVLPDCLLLGSILCGRMLSMLPSAEGINHSGTHHQGTSLMILQCLLVCLIAASWRSGSGSLWSRAGSTSGFMESQWDTYKVSPVRNLGNTID